MKIHRMKTKAEAIVKRLPDSKSFALLIFSALLPVAALILTFQQAPACESGQPGKLLNEPVNEAPAQRFDRSSESFAPAVKKVAPAVVRIVTVLNSNNPADLTSGAQDSLRSYVSGQAP